MAPAHLLMNVIGFTSTTVRPWSVVPKKTTVKIPLRNPAPQNYNSYTQTLYHKGSDNRLALYSIDNHADTSTTDFENIVGKWEIARNGQFLLFPQCFLLIQIVVFLLCPYFWYHIFICCWIWRTKNWRKGLRKERGRIVVVQFVKVFKNSS